MSRRTFSEDFKRSAVKLVAEQGYSVAHSAAQASQIPAHHHGKSPSWKSVA